MPPVQACLHKHPYTKALNSLCIWQGTNQAGLTSYATQLKPEQGNPSQGQTHQGSAATAPAPTSAPAAAAMPQPQISTTEASAPSSSLPAASASTASAAQQQEHFSLSSIDKLPAAAQQPQGTASAITHALPMLPEGPMASTGVNAAESISQGLSAQHQPPAPNGPALEMQPTHGAGSTDTRQHSQAANAAVQNGVIKPEPGSGLPVGSHGYQPSQSILHAAAACAPQPSPSWSVHQLPHGQWVCVMRDGATLTLAQLYYTLESVGRTLPQDRLHALGMMIEQLTRLGEKCLPPPQKAS